VGNGSDPKALIVDRTLSHGASDALDTLQVRHVSGGVSTATFKSYEQGRTKHQGEPVDWIWDDEEPEMELYGEHMTRLVARQGSLIVTYTPLKGRTPLVNRFDREAAPGRALIKMSIWDGLGHLPHLMTREQVEVVIATYEPHLRDARAYGDPVQGSGAIFTMPEDQIKLWDLQPNVQSRLHLLWGLDFGISHPFAAILIGWDKEDDIIYVLDGFKIANSNKFVQINRIRSICASAPVAWPHDGHSRDKGSGEGLAEQYRNPAEGVPGLHMLPDHAQFETGGYSTEEGVALMIDRFRLGRLLISAKLTELFEEVRDYHREEGLIVKVNDDLLSGLRVALMDRRYAKRVPMGPVDKSGPRGQWRDVPDREPQRWDIWSGELLQPERPPVREWVGSIPPRPDWMI
jgi:phage terminase large subunit-like protein